MEHAFHVAAVSEAIFSETRHLHGLTKTSIPLARLAAVLRDAGALRRRRNIGRLLKRFLPDITASERRIVADAVRLQTTGSDVPTSDAAVEGRERARYGVACRIAAIVRIAGALDRSRTQDVEIAAVLDDGEAVEILLSGGASARENALAASKEVAFWNSLMPRPIRLIRAHAGKRPRSALINPRDTAADAAHRIFQRQLDQFFSRTYGLPYDQDIEYVHEMRVALRRLRAALRVFRKVVGYDLTELGGELKRLAGVLGEVRDIDVFTAFLSAYAEQAPDAHSRFLERLIQSQHRKRRRLYRGLGDVLGSARYVEFGKTCCSVRAGWGAAAEDTEDGRIADRAPRMLRKRLKRVLKYDRRLDRLAGEDQHQLRIECKKLRYTAEFLSDIYRGHLAEIIAPMVRMQDALGDVHDADVYRERVIRYSRRHRPGEDAEPARNAANALLSHIQRWREEALREAASTWNAFRRQKALRKVRKLIQSPKT